MKKTTYLPSLRSDIDSFYVMDLLYSANKLESTGKKIFHLELGEPLFMTPKKVLNEARALTKKKIPGYTPSNGILDLRQKISEYYLTNYEIDVDKDQVFITTGSSGAFLLSFLSCFDPGSKVAIFNPVYPAYRNILKSLNINVVEIYPNKIEKIDLMSFSMKNIDGLIISNPNNPNGQVFSQGELSYIYEFCSQNKIVLISDEIYHGIEYEGKTPSLLNYGENVIVINSFSKFFCMPGWRLGWTIIPRKLTNNFLKLSQNLFISSGNIAQYSALKIFDCIDELKKIVNHYRSTRDKVVQILKTQSIAKFEIPKGAFYFYLNISKTKLNSFDFVKKVMNETGVVITPGLDFDKRNGNSTVRLSFSSDPEKVIEGAKKLAKWLKTNY